MNNLTTIYVVRHAESVFNATKDKEKAKYDGELGASLTDLGKEQAKQIAKDMQGVDFAAIFSSDLARAKETAGIIALEKKIAIKTTKLIGERSVWDYFRRSGHKTMKELREDLKKDLIKLDEKGKMQYRHSPSMESAEEGAIRLLAFIKEAATAYQGKTIMIVCHGNIMRSLLTHLGYAKYDELPNGSIENAGYFILESDGSKIVVKETYGVNKQKEVVRDF